MVHLNTGASNTAAWQVPDVAKRLDSGIQLGYAPARHDPDDSDRHITPNLPAGVGSMRPRVRFLGCLESHMSSVNTSTDQSSNDLRAAQAYAGDADGVPSGITIGLDHTSIPRIRIARPHRA